jgi:hypothetical protein
MPSSSGKHDIHIGDQLADALSSLLTGAPNSYTTSVAPPMFAQANRIGEVALRRESYSFFMSSIGMAGDRDSHSTGTPLIRPCFKPGGLSPACW